MTSASRLGLIFALCVAVRVLVLAVGPASLEDKVVQAIPDGNEYRTLARNLARHAAFSLSAEPPYRPDVLRTPVYPLFLAPFFGLAANPLIAIVIVQLVLSALLVWGLFRLALELGLAPRPALLAALLCSLSLNLSFLAAKLVTETLFTLLLVITVLLANRFRQFRRVRDLAAAGACCGLLVLTRPIALAFPLLLFAYVLFLMRREYRLWPRALILPACASLVVLPWVLRNGKATGRYVVSTAGEHNLVLYNAATAISAERGVTLVEARDLMRDEAIAESGPLDTLDMAHYWQRLSPVAWRHVLARPVTALKIQAIGFVSSLAMPLSFRPLLVHSGVTAIGEQYTGQQAGALLSRGRPFAALRALWDARLSRLGAAGITLLALAALFHLLLLVTAAIGIFSRSGRSLLWLLLPIAYFLLVTGALGDARFRAPIEPLLCLFAAVGLSRAQAQAPAQATRL